MVVMIGRMEEEDYRTGKLPWIELVEVDLGDDGDGDGEAGAAAAEVVHHQLLVRRVEPEPRRQLQVLTAAHLSPPSPVIVRSPASS
ncbi:Os01g0884350, partial [Oryza sativa Japonica Group]